MLFCGSKLLLPDGLVLKTCETKSATTCIETDSRLISLVLQQSLNVAKCDWYTDREDFLILTPDQEDSVIEWLKVNECLFYKNLNEHKDTEMKNHLWAAKADELEIETAVLKIWFDSMYPWFGKLTKTQSRDGAADNTERDQ